MVMPTDTDENLPAGIGMEEAVKMLALEKARACYKSCRNGVADETDFAGSKIIGSDTIVYTDRILGKPQDRADAWSMIDSIRGTHHFVCTGVAVIDYDTGAEQVVSDVTRVYVQDMTDAEIDAYLDTDEPYDKAGAYAIQGIFGQYIDHFEGDYENVVGLPYHLLAEML